MILREGFFVMAMLISEVMTRGVVSIRGGDTADTAARLLSRNNIGALPVTDDQGRLVGMLTDRDLVTRCLAAGLSPRETPVSQIMTSAPATIPEDATPGEAAFRMGQRQVRRLPVVREGVLTGIVSLGDLARCGESCAAQTLRSVSENISRR